MINRHFTAYDGNGNVTGLADSTTGKWSARYEYGPFGELLRATGPMAKINPFRFSTKYQDDETDLLYYGYRYYSASTGRWISRDPIEEQGGANNYAFVANSPMALFDVLGLSPEKWSWGDGEPGEHKPQQHDEGGTQVLFWEPLAMVYRCPASPGGCWELDTGGSGFLRYWYSNAQVQTHERVHVADWTRTWGELRDKAVSLENQYCDKELPDCLKKVIEGTMKQAYFAYGKWLAANWDCSDYPPGAARDQRCREKLQIEPIAASLAMQMHREIDECFKNAGY